MTLVVSLDAARHAEVDLSRFDMHEAPVRGREEPVSVYAVPDPSNTRELTAIGDRDNGNSDKAVV